MGAYPASLDSTSATTAGNTAANGAIYVFGDELLNFCKTHNKLKDFSTEVIPKLIGKIATFHTTEPFIDIGTPEAMVKANEIFTKKRQ